MLELIVKDNGIGIAPDDMDRVCKPFEQADGSLTRKYEYTGLSMAVVKALTYLHQENVSLESGLGQDTRVAVRLPASRLRRLP